MRPLSIATSAELATAFAASSITAYRSSLVSPATHRLWSYCATTASLKSANA
jgi:hypothetical protein